MALSAFRELAVWDEGHVSPALETFTEKEWATPDEFWARVAEDLDDYKEDWLEQNRELIEEEGDSPERAWEAYRQARIDVSHGTISAYLLRHARMPERCDGMSCKDWLDARPRMVRDGELAPMDEDALELEAVVRDALRQALEESELTNTWGPEIELDKDPSIVRSALDPAMRLISWSFCFPSHWENTVYIDMERLGFLDLTSESLGFEIAQRTVRFAEGFYPDHVTWEPLTTLGRHDRPRITAIQIRRLRESKAAWKRRHDLEGNPRSMMTSPSWSAAREKLRSAAAMSSPKKNPPVRMPRPKPEMWLLFDSNRGTNMPQDFASEIRRDHVLGVDKETWETLADGDTAENEWIWDAWQDVLDNALIVEDFATYAPELDHLLEVAYDAKQEGKDADHQRIMREYRAELEDKIIPKVRRIAHEIDERGKRTERDELLNQHHAVVYKLWQTENGDVFAVPWDMEWDEDEDEWIWPECADCGQSTATGTTDPHVCGGSVPYAKYKRRGSIYVFSCPTCDRDVRDCGGCLPPTKNPPPRATLRRPWRTGTTIVLEWAPATMGWTPWLESARGNRLPISIPVTADADEAFRFAEAFMSRVQTPDLENTLLARLERAAALQASGSTRRDDDDPVLNPGVAQRPYSAQLEDAKSKYEEFHRKKPVDIGEFHRDFEIPSTIGKLGNAIHILYRSDKKDPATGKQPKKPVDYIHEHYAGVHCYAPVETKRGTEVCDVPSFITDCDALVLLGSCLGFRYEDDDGEHDAEGTDPLPELYSTPCGKALLVIQDKQEVLAMIWGGGLGVWARGIDG